MEDSTGQDSDRGLAQPSLPLGPVTRVSPLPIPFVATTLSHALDGDRAQAEASFERISSIIRFDQTLVEAPGVLPFKITDGDTRLEIVPPASQTPVAQLSPTPHPTSTDVLMNDVVERPEAAPSGAVPEQSSAENIGFGTFAEDPFTPHNDADLYAANNMTGDWCDGAHEAAIEAEAAYEASIVQELLTNVCAPADNMDLSLIGRPIEEACLDGKGTTRVIETHHAVPNESPAPMDVVGTTEFLHMPETSLHDLTVTSQPVANVLADDNTVGDLLVAVGVAAMLNGGDDARSSTTGTTESIDDSFPRDDLGHHETRDVPAAGSYITDQPLEVDNDGALLGSPRCTSPMKMERDNDNENGDQYSDGSVDGASHAVAPMACEVDVGALEVSPVASSVKFEAPVSDEPAPASREIKTEPHDDTLVDYALEEGQPLETSAMRVKLEGEYEQDYPDDQSSAVGKTEVYYRQDANPDADEGSHVEEPAHGDSDDAAEEPTRNDAVVKSEEPPLVVHAVYGLAPTPVPPPIATPPSPIPPPDPETALIPCKFYADGHDANENHLWAYVLWFVRGPPASGALANSRLVCRNWRDIIDTYLSRVPACEPWMTAYSIGYLSPIALMPRIVTNDLGTTLTELVHRVIQGHHLPLYYWLRRNIAQVIKQHAAFRGSRAPVARETLATDLKKMMSDTRNRVKVGDWKGLSRPDIVRYRDDIHAADFPHRAASVGVRFDNLQAQCVKWLHRDGARGECFDVWSPEDIRATVEACDKYEARAALPWLIQRGFVDRTQISSWVTERYIHNLESFEATAELIVSTCEEFGWCSVSGRALMMILQLQHWALFQRAVRLSPEWVRHELWKPNGEYFNAFTIFDVRRLRDTFKQGEEFLADICACLAGWRHTNAGRGRYEAPSDVEALNWLYAEGFFRDSTPAQTYHLLVYIVEQFAGSAPDHNVVYAEWLLAHLATPTHADILLRFAKSGHGSDQRFVDLFCSYAIPWEPLKLVPNQYSEAALTARNNLVRRLLASGNYHMPAITARLKPENAPRWLGLLEAAEAVGQMPHPDDFDPNFVAQAARYPQLNAFIARSRAKAEADAQEAERERQMRYAIYELVLGGTVKREAGGDVTHNGVAQTDDARLIQGIDGLIARGMTPLPQTLIELARAYSTRVSTPHAYAGIAITRVTVTPSAVAPMHCLIKLAAAFPDNLPSEVTQILADVGIASVVTAHQAGFPLHEGLIEAFEAAGNVHGAAWARQVAENGFENVEVPFTTDIITIE